MTAICVEKPGVLTLLNDQPVGRPQPGEALIRVERAGICGSDLHIFHGANPFAVYPRIIGHEVAGKVVEVGPNAKGFAVGDRVVLDPVVSCGHCYPCRIGRPNVCAHLQVFGVHLDGGFQDFFCAPVANLIKVPAAVSAEIAAVAEPLSIGVNILSRMGCCEQDTLLIYGAGTIGLMVLQVAKIYGARCVVADIEDEKLKRALAFGADAVINSKHTPVPDIVRTELDGLGPSMVIDAAGVPALLVEACRIASPAARIGLLGFSPKPCDLIQKDINQKELTLFGSRQNRGFIPQVIKWIEQGRLRPAAMITQTFDSRDVKKAFAFLETSPSEAIKVQLVFNA